MTLGVLHRARSLSDGGFVQAVKGDDGLWRDPDGEHPPYRHLIPLIELLSYALRVGKTTKRVNSAYTALTDAIGSEFEVLLHADPIDISDVLHREDVANAIVSARHDNVDVEPGYDGVYGSAIPRLSASNPSSEQRVLSI